MTPFISIITVCYNNDKTVQRTMDAIAAQSFRDFEYIFVANGCLDKSRELAYVFRDAHPEINMRVVDIEVNTGLTKGRNTGLDAAIGEYVLFNDADDWMDPDCLELLAAKAQEGRYDSIHAGRRCIGENDAVRFEYRVTKSTKYTFSTHLQAHLISRNVIKENNIAFRNIFIDDTVFFLDFVKFSRGMQVVTEVIYNVDGRGVSICKGELADQLLASGRASFSTIVKTLIDIAKDSKDSDFLELVEASAFFIFISCIRTALIIDNGQSIAEKHKYLYDILKAAFHNILSNRLIKRQGLRYFEKRSANLVWVFAWLERLHLVVPALWVFSKLRVKK